MFRLQFRSGRSIKSITTRLTDALANESSISHILNLSKIAIGPLGLLLLICVVGGVLWLVLPNLRVKENRAEPASRARLEDIMHLCEQDRLPAWVKAEELNKLITTYLVTDDRRLFYIVFGIRYRFDGESASFIHFEEIAASEPEFGIFQRFDTVFVRTGDRFEKRGNVFAENRSAGRLTSRLQVRLSDATLNVDLEADIENLIPPYRQSALSESDARHIADQVAEKRYFSQYTIRCPMGVFTGSVSTGIGRREIAGTAYIDSWCMNKDVGAGNWRWGFLQTERFVLMFYHSYGNPTLVNYGNLLLWEDGRLALDVYPSADLLSSDEDETILRLRYARDNFHIDTALGVGSIARGKTVTALAPFRARINSGKGDQCYSGHAVIERKLPITAGQTTLPEAAIE